VLLLTASRAYASAHLPNAGQAKRRSKLRPFSADGLVAEVDLHRRRAAEHGLIPRSQWVVRLLFHQDLCKEVDAVEVGVVWNRVELVPGLLQQHLPNQGLSGENREAPGGLAGVLDALRGELAACARVAVVRLESIMRMAVAALLALVLAMSEASGQDRIWYADGEATGDLFGTAVDIADDVDFDGTKDLLIGAFAHSCDGTPTSPPDGIGYLISISNGQLNTWCGNEEALAASLTALEDVDRDGLGDYALAAPSFEDPTLGPGSGRVLVISAKTGAILFEVRGDQPGLQFGYSIAGLPDLDADGYPELLIAAPGYFPTGGEVFVLSTKDGSTLRTHYGEESADFFGRQVACVGDVDADGVLDYAIHNNLGLNANNKGRVHVYSGATGIELWQVSGTVNFDYLGESIADGGDIDGDGYADVLCGGVVGPTGCGHFDAYSGNSGTRIFTIDGVASTEIFGWSCCMVGDANDDGVNDYLVGAIQNNHDGNSAGCARLISGKTLRRLYTFFPGYKSRFFGYCVRGGIDFNKDGLGDFVISNSSGITEATGGRVSIFAGNDLYLQASKLAPIPGDLETFDIRGAAPDSFAILFLTDINGTPFFEPIVVGFLDQNGELSDTLDVPTEAAGLTVTFQAFSTRRLKAPHWVDSSPVVIDVQ
jgi:hypothetical protein